MGYLVFNFLLMLYLIYDGRKRQVPNLWLWAIGTLLIGVFLLPFYLAKRPLKAGETREGGTAWNVLRSFALLWTVFIIFAAAAGFSNAGSVIEATQTDAERTGAVIGTGLGIGMLGCLWFVPMMGALVLGFFLKKSSVVEEGPTGPLKEEEADEERPTPEGEM